MPTRRPVDAPSHLYLVDASGFIFRAFHALPPLMKKANEMVLSFCTQGAAKTMSLFNG